MRRRGLMIALSSVIALLIVGVWLTGNAILRNRVPVSAPPGAMTRVATYLTTNVAETADDPRFPELRTRAYEMGAAELVDLVRRACERLGWQDVGVDERQRKVRAQVRTPLLGFTDDLEARVVETVDGSVKLEVRSSSRVGRGDLGANLRHVLDLYQAVDALIAEGRQGG